MATDPLTRPLNELRDQLVAAARRQEPRPLDNTGRAYEQRAGWRDLHGCGWWGTTRTWGDNLGSCPNCGQTEHAPVPEKRWVRVDA